jgi:hypothetical protein
MKKYKDPVYWNEEWGPPDEGELTRRAFRQRLIKLGIDPQTEYNLIVQTDHEFDGIFIDQWLNSTNEKELEKFCEESASGGIDTYEFGRTMSLKKKRDVKELLRVLKEIENLSKAASVVNA